MVSAAVVVIGGGVGSVDVVVVWVVVVGRSAEKYISSLIFKE